MPLDGHTLPKRLLFPPVIFASNFAEDHNRSLYQTYIKKHLHHSD